MKLRPDQQRVASLLKETITLMCRNGLIFDSQFCIEATIGVTLDDKDVFVVSLNEVIGKDERSDVESNGGDPLPGSPEKKPLAIKRGRPRKKTPKVTPKKAARKNKAEDSWGESADDFDDYASSDDASPPAKKSKDLLQEELNMTCDAGENVAVKQELQYDSSNVSRVPEEGEELLFSLEGQQSSELQLQQASNSMSESTSQVPSTSQQIGDDIPCMLSRITKQDTVFSGLDEEVIPTECHQVGLHSADHKEDEADEDLATASAGTDHQEPLPGDDGWSFDGVAPDGISLSDLVKDFACPHPGCDVKVKRRDNLKRHMLRHKHSKQGRYSCPSCPRSFTRQDYLKGHIDSHHEGRRYSCINCPKKYKTKASLRLHEASHEGTFKYMCDTCGQGFNYTTNFRSHVNRHSGNKPFHCEQCNKSFFEPSSLKYHVKNCGVIIRTHICRICSKAFKNQRTLTAHEKTHDHEYNCPKCGKQYLYKCSFLRHEKKCNMYQD